MTDVIWINDDDDEGQVWSACETIRFNSPYVPQSSVDELVLSLKDAVLMIDELTSLIENVKLIDKENVYTISKDLTMQSPRIKRMMETIKKAKESEK